MNIMPLVAESAGKTTEVPFKMMELGLQWYGLQKQIKETKSAQRLSKQWRYEDKQDEDASFREQMGFQVEEADYAKKSSFAQNFLTMLASKPAFAANLMNKWNTPNTRTKQPMTVGLGR